MNSERAGAGCQEAPETVLVTSYSTPPTGTSMHAVYRHCGVVLEVDVSSHRVVHADFTVLTGLANDFLRRLVVAFDMSRSTVTGPATRPGPSPLHGAAVGGWPSVPE